MIGAMLCARNSAIWWVPAKVWELRGYNLGADVLRVPAGLQFLFGRFYDPGSLGFCRCVMTAARDRISQLSTHDRDAFDQLRYTLKQQQCEANGDDQLGRIHRQSTGIGRLFILLQGEPKERPA